jgi:hypothetical protein
MPRKQSKKQTDSVDAQPVYKSSFVIEFELQEKLKQTLYDLAFHEAIDEHYRCDMSRLDFIRAYPVPPRKQMPDYQRGWFVYPVSNEDILNGTIHSNKAMLSAVIDSMRHTRKNTKDQFESFYFCVHMDMVLLQLENGKRDTVPCMVAQVVLYNQPPPPTKPVTTPSPISVAVEPAVCPVVSIPLLSSPSPCPSTLVPNVPPPPLL